MSLFLRMERVFFTAAIFPLSGISYGTIFLCLCLLSYCRHSRRLCSGLHISFRFRNTFLRSLCSPLICSLSSSPASLFGILVSDLVHCFLFTYFLIAPVWHFLLTVWTCNSTIWIYLLDDLYAYTVGTPGLLSHITQLNLQVGLECIPLSLSLSQIKLNSTNKNKRCIFSKFLPLIPDIYSFRNQQNKIDLKIKKNITKPK